MATYFEMHNVVFRGTLAGANGVARFRLTADAINAINTVNVVTGAVGFEQIATFSGSVGNGAAIASITTQIPDSGNMLEILFSSSQTNPNVALRWNGSAMQRFHLGMAKGAAARYTPITAYRRNVNAGTYTIQAVNTSGSTRSYSGYLMVRYMRETGA